MAAHDQEGRDVLPRVRKTRAVLAVLAIASPKPVLREELTGLLWSTRGRPQACASLRQCVHELQELLLPLGGEILQIDRFHLTLRPEHVWIDLRALGTGPDANLGLLRGPLLQDVAGLDPSFDRWLERQRQRASAIIRAAGADLVAGTAGPEAALNAAALLASADPSDEFACRALVKLLGERGDIGAAERAFARCRAALSASTGAPPGTETEAELARIRDAVARAPAAERQVSTTRIGVMPPRTPDGSREDPLSLGLAEEITTALSQFRGISCVASTSLARLRGQERGLDSVFDAVELDFLLDGTIQRSDGRVRVNARLLDMNVKGEVIWARRFEREFEGSVHLAGRNRGGDRGAARSRALVAEEKPGGLEAEHRPGRP